MAGTFQIGLRIGRWACLPMALTIAADCSTGTWFTHWDWPPAWRIGRVIVSWHSAGNFGVRQLLPQSVMPSGRSDADCSLMTWHTSTSLSTHSAWHYSQVHLKMDSI